MPERTVPDRSTPDTTPLDRGIVEQAVQEPVGEQIPESSLDGALCRDGVVRSCYGGEKGSLGRGECKAGTQKCIGGQWEACLGAILPKPEVCDGKDNDCDGKVDDNIVSKKCSTTKPGVCKAGVMRCVSGKLSCVSLTKPIAEKCDGLDNDCDGKVDDNIISGKCSTPKLGECKAGTMRCVSGKLSCFANKKASAETCDGKDNDCDGKTDEGISTKACYAPNHWGNCFAGVSSCQNGKSVCSPDHHRRLNCQSNADCVPCGKGAICGTTGICKHPQP